MEGAGDPESPLREELCRRDTQSASTYDLSEENSFFGGRQLLEVYESSRGQEVNPGCSHSRYHSCGSARSSIHCTMRELGGGNSCCI